MVATDFTTPIDSVYATVLGNKPRYVYRVFFDLNDLRRNVFAWVNDLTHLGGRESMESTFSFDEVNGDFVNLINQAVKELNRGNLDISQLEEYILKQ